MANHDRRGCAGDAGHAVMLGQPVPAVAPCFSVPGEIQGITQRLRRIAAGSYGREVQDGKWNHVLAPAARMFLAGATGAGIKGTESRAFQSPCQKRRQATFDHRTRGSGGLRMAQGSVVGRAGQCGCEHRGPGAEGGIPGRQAWALGLRTGRQPEIQSN